MKGLKQRKALYVCGEWVPTSDAAAVINPANEAVLGEAPLAERIHVESALAAAREAFDRGPWPRMRPTQRQAMIS